MRYVLVELDFYSPYVSTPLFAEQGAGPPLPPPLTLVGALSAAYHYPEEVRGIPPYILKSVKYVSFWAPPYATVTNISRHFSGFSQKRGRLPLLSVATELVKRPHDEKAQMELVELLAKIRSKKYADAVKKDMKKYGVYDVIRREVQMFQQPSATSETYFYALRPEGNYEDRAYVLYVLDGELEEELAEKAGEIYRVGQKEVLAASTLLGIRVERLQREVVQTRFYAPMGAFADISGCRAVYMLPVFADNYVLDAGDPFNAAEGFCVPGPIGYMVGTLASGWVGVKIVAENGAELIATVPKYAAP